MPPVSRPFRSPHDLAGLAEPRRGDPGGSSGLLPAAAVALLLQRAGPAWAVAGGTGLFIAGLPHGAFDADRQLLIARPGYALRYVIAGLAGAAAYAVLPRATLGAFLALSARHFMLEPAAGPAPRRGAIACLAIGGSALARPAETSAALAALGGTAMPRPAMRALGTVGAVGHALALLSLLHRPRDAPMWAMAASSLLLHPVLATGGVFMLGHAGPITATILRKRPHGTRKALALGIGSAIVAAIVVRAGGARSAWLPRLAAGAVGLILPHLLPARWLARGRSHASGHAGHSAQAATSAAT